jgi:hypothetical protein
MSQGEIDEMDENDARICRNLKIDTSNTRFSDSHETSMLTNVCDLIYESIKELEMNIKDWFRPVEALRRDSMMSKLHVSDNSRMEKRKTVVMANVPHFNNLGKTKSPSIIGSNISKSAIVKKNPVKGKSVVKIFDQEFDKIFNIMLGINRSVFWLFDSPYYQINDGDYTAKFEYNNQWYSQSGTGVKIFTFTDYSPKIFESIRKLDKIKNEDYAKALGPSNIFKYIWSNNMSTFKELCSTGKSGSLFYYTEDGKYMLKTIHKAEFQKMRDILKPYHEHCVKCNRSVINRFYGLHKINYVENKKKWEQYLVIMNNLFGHYEVDIRYDLKGSVTGRTTSFPDDIVPDKTIALKDNNFTEEEECFSIERSQRNDLMYALKQASEFLGEAKILGK